jgi:starch-binding outer membrane protein, SusD/RagB family
MKTIKISLFSLLLAASVVGCKKQLDILPTNIFEESITFRSVTDLEQGVLGVYSAWGGENTMINNAVLSDEVKLSNENRGQWQFEHKWQYNSATETFNFFGFYQMINRANKVLQAASGVTAFDAAEQTKKDQLIAEATALRAAAHFELLQRFGPVGYEPTGLGVTYVNSVLAPTAKPSRNTVAQTLAGIETDLATARASSLSNAPQITANYGNIRISKAFVAGLQARVALYKRDWATASTAASDAITLSGKTLATGATFTGIWTDAAATTTEPEVFLRLRRTGTGVGTLWQDTNGDVFFEPSDKLKQQYNRTTDIRFNAYFTINPTAQDTALVNKFFTSSRGPKIVDVKLMRVAEMYLIRAEAKAELNDLAGASTDINTLRAARISGYTPITYSDKATAVTEILNERFKELAFEGFRYFDLKRRGLPVARLGSDVTSSQWQNLPANDFRMVLPIPSSEVRNNPNNTQNPGY